MVASSVLDLRGFQWGLESTRGTAVPATSKILVPYIDFEPIDELFRPDEARGLVQRYKGFETPLRRGTKWTVPDAAYSYEQAPNWASMSIKGAVAPTGVGPYVYTYTRDPVADPVPSAWTLERRLSDATNFVDNEFAYAMLSRITWKAAQNGPVLFNAEGFARRIQASTFTAALSLPTPELPVAALSKVYIDSTWANLGTTQIVGQVLDWEIGFNTGLSGIMTADGRTDLDFTGYIFGSAEVQLNVKIVMLVKPGSGQYATEKTAAEAQTLRAVRIQTTGSGSRDFKWNMLLKHMQASVFKIGEREGQDIVELNLVESTDGTNFFSHVITNNVAAIV